MQTKEILIKHFDWTEQEVIDKAKKLDFIFSELSENAVLELTQFFCDEFKLSEDKFKKILKKMPSLLNFTIEGIKKKEQFYESVFSMKREEINKMVKLFPAILGASTQSVLDKENFYKSEFRVTHDDFCKMIRLSPALLSYDTDSVQEKTKFYESIFGITSIEFGKMMKVHPAFLGYSTDSVQEKAKFYEDTFGIISTEFGKMIKVFPALLSYATDSVQEKADFYESIFGITSTEFGEMIKKVPALLGRSIESVQEKVREIKDIKIPSQVIVQNPSILAVPKNTLKLRYVILRNIATREEIFSYPNWYMTSQDKTYARACYLSETGKKLNWKTVLYSEKLFGKMCGVSSDELMAKYKLTAGKFEKLRSVLEKDEIVDFNDDEKGGIEEKWR